MHSLTHVVAFYWLIVCLLLGDFTLEPQQFVGFQDDLYEDSDLFSREQRGKSPWTFCACSYFLSIYSIELELQDWKSGLHTYARVLLELIYCSLKNLRSNWVVIIALQFLSLSCPSIGLDSCYVHQLCLCHHVILMVILIQLVLRIGFGVTGLELVGVMPAVQGCCPVRCWKPVVSYHTYQTQFLCQNQVLIICMTQDQLLHTYGQKRSQITKCHK
jgi:hypothetical protein